MSAKSEYRGRLTIQRASLKLWREYRWGKRVTAPEIMRLIGCSRSTAYRWRDAIIEDRRQQRAEAAEWLARQ